MSNAKLLWNNPERAAEVESLLRERTVVNIKHGIFQHPTTGRKLGDYSRYHPVLNLGKYRPAVSHCMWFMVHGKWPSSYLGHIDKNTHNNKIDNLCEIGSEAWERLQYESVPKRNYLDRMRIDKIISDTVNNFSIYLDEQHAPNRWAAKAYSQKHQAFIYNLTTMDPKEVPNIIIEVEIHIVKRVFETLFKKHKIGMYEVIKRMKFANDSLWTMLADAFNSMPQEKLDFAVGLKRPMSLGPQVDLETYKSPTAEEWLAKNKHLTDSPESAIVNLKENV